MATLPQWYSQYGEDRWIVENLRVPATGYFVEVGAADGVQGSNTLHFEQLGWRGLLIEPDPRSMAKLRESGRKAELDGRCVSLRSGPVGFTLEREPTLSGIIRTEGEKIQVESAPLTQILDDHGAPEIDLLSIDTEGTELDVWASLDLRRYRPAVVIIEYRTIGIPANPFRVIRRLERCGYKAVHKTVANLIFLDGLSGRARVHPQTGPAEAR